ncbi:MAG TPA: hypothetical protein VGM56_30965, partial [Byssovorax sp.]
EPVPYVPTGDAADDCGSYVHLKCGLPEATTKPGDCYVLTQQCPFLCGSLAFNCHAVNESCMDGGFIADADVDLDCSICLNGVGRSTEGHARIDCTGEDLGAYFAAAAELEDASVHAFVRLRAELADLGAPRSLRRSAGAAARDERRHTRATTRLARRFGARAARARVADVGRRTLLEIAIENAVEGCVRETFGALVATYQAEHARDGGLRRELGRIARDEARHAALGWAIARWFDARLDADARARVAAAARDAVEDLARAPSLSETLGGGAAGLPDASARRALVAGLRASLWDRDLGRRSRRDSASAA